MKHLLALIVLVTLALTPRNASALRFDMWETGMKIDEIVHVARAYNIPIARSGVVHSSSKFDQNLVDEQFLNASVLDYRTKIGQYNSRIFLKLSNQPKQLYEIEVRIYGIKNRDAFTKEMVETLTQKYGTYTERKEKAFLYFEWEPEESGRITFRMSSAEASVLYTDLKIKRPPKPKEKK